MKKTLAIILMSLMLALMLVISVSAETTPYGTVVNAQYTDTAPSMAKALPDSSWGSPVIHIDKNSANAGITQYYGTVKQDLSLDMYAKWTNDTLYLCFTSPDPDFRGQQYFWWGDGIQMVIMPGIIDVSYCNGVSTGWTRVEQFEQYDWAVTFDIDDNSASCSEVAEGYSLIYGDDATDTLVVKFAIPASSLYGNYFEKPSTGDYFSFALTRIDGSDTSNEACSGWLEWGDFYNGSKGWNPNDKSRYVPTVENDATTTANTIRLVGKNGEGADTPDTPSPTVEAGGISLGNVSGLVGKTITVPLSLNDNPGIVSLAVEVEYDESALTLKSVEDTEVFPGANHSDNYSSPYVFSWENDTAESNLYNTGIIANLTFEVKSDASNGVYPLTLNVADDGIVDYKLKTVEMETNNGSVTVRDYVVGDVNGDGEVTPLDRLTLSRYLARWKDYPQSVVKMNASDVNEDGAVTSKDRIILSRYFANWNGYLTLPYVEAEVPDPDTVVVLTASDGGHLFEDYNASAGYVKFRKMNSNGTLGNEVYSAKASSFGLMGAHDDEAALGSAYKIKFEVENGTANVLSYESLKVATLSNRGVNSKIKGYYPIQDFVRSIRPVSTFSENAENEFITYTDVVSSDNSHSFTTVSSISGKAYADLTEYDINGDGKGDYGIYDEYTLGYYKMGLGTYIDKDSSYYFEARSRLNIQTGDDDGGTTYAGDEPKRIFGVDYGDGHVTARAGWNPNNDVWTLSESEWYTLAQVRALGVTDDNIMMGAWPGTDGHGTPLSKTDASFDAGPFMAFKHQGQLKTTVGETLQILGYADVINGGSPVQNQLLKGMCNEYVITGTGHAGGYKQYTGKITQDAVWSLRDSSPVVKENGKYDEGWMLYSINPYTRELKVAENIGAYEDGKSTYAATGTLRAYSISKKTVTIGDAVFSTSYDDLNGTAFQSRFYMDGQWYAGAEYLGDLFNQYVNYVVVDDKIVYIEAANEDDYRFLVVSSVSGIDENGFLKVNAWDTADGELKTVKVMSYNGVAVNGTVNIPANTILGTKSYDPESDSYGLTEITGLPTEGARVGQDGYMQVYSTALKDSRLLGTGEGLDLVWFEQNFNFAMTGIRWYKYQGKFRPAPTSWSPWKAVSGGSDPTSTANLTKNMTEDDKYIFIFAPDEVEGCPIRIYEGVVTDPTWFCAGWRLVGPGEKLHIYFNVKAENVIGFDGESSSEPTEPGTPAPETGFVMIPDYQDPIDQGSWYLPTSGHANAWHMNMGYDVRFDGNSGGDYWPWGKVIDVDLGSNLTTYCVLDLVTMKTINIKADSSLSIKSNRIYTVEGGKIKDEINVKQFYSTLIGEYGHADINLGGDAFELFTGTRDISGKNYALADNTGRGNVAVPEKYIWEGLRVPEINKWMTKNDKTIAKAYDTYGSYTLVKNMKYVGICSVYENTAGDVEFCMFGCQAGLNDTYNQTANPCYPEYTVDQVKALFGGETTLATVTLVNMERVKMQKNVNPYDGIPACTYCFAQSQVTVDHTYDQQ